MVVNTPILTDGPRGTMRFQNRTVLVTGAADGIGAAIVTRLLNEGANLLATDADATALQRADAEWRQTSQYNALRTATLDVRDLAACQALLAEFASTTTEGRLDAVIHSAAVSVPGTVTSVDPAEWRRVVAVNLDGAFHVARSAIPHLFGGAMILVASQLGLVGGRDSIAYTATKGALVNMTRSLALDHAADGVRVCCLCPGPTHTKFLERSFDRSDNPARARAESLAKIPLGRFAEPAEIAAAAAFLASSDASFITGSVLTVDGGYTAH